jgi:UDP-GlcNAc3NAcA epimerase
LAGALVAAKLYAPIAHVEAGLRSLQPIPEETNRIVTDRLSRWLFCPTPTAVENLRREGITSGVYQTGDVMYDVAILMRDRAHEKSTILTRLGLVRGEFQLATLHRAENTDERCALARAVDYLIAAAKESPVVLPLHPRTREASHRFDISFGAIKVVDPVGYLDMIALMDGCTRIFTDSGGLQKEAYFFGKPCITLRNSTEWVETIEAGWNRLWIDSDYAPRRHIEVYGDGKAAERIVAVIEAEL